MRYKGIFLLCGGASLVTSSIILLAILLSGCSNTSPSVSAAQTLPNDPAQYPNPFTQPSPQATQSTLPVQSSQAPVQPSAQPPTSSGDPKVDLANFLVQSGAKMYTTGWCPQCKRQLKDFGQASEIVKQIEVDCEKQADLCGQKGITGYPTWEFNGQTQQARGFPLSELAQLAGFPNAQALQMEQGVGRGRGGQ